MTVAPSVVGAPVPSAQGQLRAAGLPGDQVTISQQCGAGSGGLILSLDNRCIDVAGEVLVQDPSAGAVASRGSAVNLTESSGKRPNGMPCTIR